MTRCKVCNHVLRNTWYTYNVREFELDICCKCEKDLRKVILEQKSDEKACMDIYKMTRRKT